MQLYNLAHAILTTSLRIRADNLADSWESTSHLSTLDGRNFHAAGSCHGHWNRR